MLPQDSTHLIAKTQQAIGPHENLLTIAKRRKLQCYGHVSRSSGLAKTILQGTVKGGSRRGRYIKRGGKTTSGNGQAWSLPSPRGQWRTEKWRKLVMKSSLVPQRPPRLRGLMIMIRVTICARLTNCVEPHDNGASVRDHLNKELRKATQPTQHYVTVQS